MGLRRHGHHVYRTPQWQALRLQAKRRDDFKCVRCGARGKLEVDHVRGIRDAPDLAYDLANLQTLCPACHSRKTAIEVGFAPLDPKRQEWRDLLNTRNFHHA